MKDSIRRLLHNVNDIFVAVLRTVYFYFQINKSKHLSFYFVCIIYKISRTTAPAPPPTKKTPTYTIYKYMIIFFFYQNTYAEINL